MACRLDGEILLIEPLEINVSEISIEIEIFSLKKICLKMSSAKCCPFRRGLNALNGNSMTTVSVDVALVGVA